MRLWRNKPVSLLSQPRWKASKAHFELLWRHLQAGSSLCEQEVLPWVKERAEERRRDSACRMQR